MSENLLTAPFSRDGAAFSKFAALLLSVLSSSVLAQNHSNVTNELQRLKALPFEELLNLEITTVSRRPERLSDAPSAIQVITADDIRRSGATSLPEALRLASNLQIAQVSSHQWAISARGFTSVIADKLLVLIDGRSVYTPLFSGVFWDVQNVMLEDLDRIEVVSGPGAALWGANAVNGVINIISKSAKDTQGTLLSAGGGSQVNGMGSVRYGSQIGKDLYFRIYGTGFDRDETVFPNGDGAGNDWRLGQGGFRTDWLPAHGEIVTVQGDLYGGELDRAGLEETTVNGQNLLARWTHPFSSESDLTVQAYWDRTWRNVPRSFNEDLNTFDFDFQHRFPIGERNTFIWGAGYRLMADRVGNSPALAFYPENRNLQLFSAFAQDEIALVEDRLLLTLGSKFEHNDYSGFEVQPSVRFSWRVSENHHLWAAISRAVRSPSRLDTEVFAPAEPPFYLQGGGDAFESETVIAYELGYRTRITKKVEASISTFFNDYDDIRSREPIPGSPTQSMILNELSAETYGAEVAVTWQALESWRIRGGYTFLKKHIFLEDSLDPVAGQSEGNDPHHQFQLQSMINLPGQVEFDSVLRYVDNLNQFGPSVPKYFSLDLRLAWRPSSNWEISLVGQNLLDDQHPEFGWDLTRQEIPRSVYGKITWTF